MGERELIAKIAALPGPEPPGLLQGIGDDCAVVEGPEGKAFLLTMDTLVPEVHFLQKDHPPRLLGRKSVSVNVSDIAAMGGTPLYCLLSLTLAPSFDGAYVEALCAGMAEACRRYGCRLVGGDTVQGPNMSLSLTLIGESRQDLVVYRHGAQPGDDIWVSGPLGSAAAGLALLQRGSAGKAFTELLEAHFDPKARTGLAPSLAAKGIHAMIDLSDGLATDLAHICSSSGVGAKIYADLLPAAPALMDASRETGTDALQWQVSGGEDYELLFTAGPEDKPQLLEISEHLPTPLCRIGEIVAGTGVTMERHDRHGKRIVEDIGYRGYEHFVDGG
ncbi:MAG: thiamine-phosphate kinase [Deltaproteobacteria bacterium]|nr:MAG: thiamine-phosphate kinase [Deltaproteobacteria bacterium]